MRKASSSPPARKRAELPRLIPGRNLAALALGVIPPCSRATPLICTSVAALPPTSTSISQACDSRHHVGTLPAEPAAAGVRQAVARGSATRRELRRDVFSAV